jgi:hypothetical protein
VPPFSDVYKELSLLPGGELRHSNDLGCELELAGNFQRTLFHLVITGYHRRGNR